MRTIKFKRVFKNRLTGDISFMSWGCIDYKDEPKYNFESFKAPGTNSHADPIADIQFTGLLDRNGVEIYEGDRDKSGLIIKWNQLHCCFGLFSESGYQCELYADCCDSKGNAPKQWMTSNFEVIGNIYENENLIKP